MTTLLLILMPIMAEIPQQPVVFVQVDAVVINRVRSYSESTDAWGRTQITTHEQTWVSFWSDFQLPTFLGGGRIPFAIDHGWWTMSQVKNIAPATDGWMIESQDGINVTAGKLLLIESDFDWELRNRRVYRPMQMP